MHEMRIRPGRPYPLGSTWNGKGVNFALYSKNATKVELCLFDTAEQPTPHDEPKQATDQGVEGPKIGVQYPYKLRPVSMTVFTAPAAERKEEGRPLVG